VSKSCQEVSTVPGEGFVDQYMYFGEGGYTQTEQEIQALLAES